MRFGVAEEEPVLRHFTKRRYVRGSPEEMHEQIFSGIDTALKETGYGPEKLAGVGIDVPAVVNRETGAILWGPDWDFMAGASLTQPIAERYGVPVVADVDPVMATWGERWAGAGKTCERSYEAIRVVVGAERDRDQRRSHRGFRAPTSGVRRSRTAIRLHPYLSAWPTLPSLLPSIILRFNAEALSVPYTSSRRMQ